MPLDENGQFETHLAAVPGVNEVVVKAVDRAGNRTRRMRSFAYRANRQVDLAFDPEIPTDGTRRLLTRGETLGVTGSSTAEPGSRMIVCDARGSVVADTLVDGGGGFAFAVPSDEAGATYTIRIVAISGATESETSFVALRYSIPPSLTFAEAPPQATSVRWLQLWGSAGDAVQLAINGTDLLLTEGRFETLLALQRGGLRRQWLQ